MVPDPGLPASRPPFRAPVRGLRMMDARKLRQQRLEHKQARALALGAIFGHRRITGPSSSPPKALDIKTRGEGGCLPTALDWSPEPD
ncbi:Solute Carrier Family 35 Member F5 [Manis pentadactyla]|nr:Solute Carrier Family 35 Member F5 [Manis pentadactyla]